MIRGLPSRIKKLRKQHGLSQKAVALKIGVSPAIVSAYETGERTPSLENLLALSQLFRCSCDNLLGNKDSDDPDAVLNVKGLTDEQVHALQIIVDGIKTGDNTHKPKS